MPQDTIYVERFCLRWRQEVPTGTYNWYLRRLASDLQFWGYVHIRTTTISENRTISGVSILEFTGPATRPGVSRRNTVVISSGPFDWSNPATWTGILDRSPCGTGTCAKMAVMHARGELGLNEDFIHEGILGTTFTGRLVRQTSVGPYQAVVPTITGSAHIYAMSNYILDPDDPFPEGSGCGEGSASGAVVQPREFRAAACECRGRNGLEATRAENCVQHAAMVPTNRASVNGIFAGTHRGPTTNRKLGSRAQDDLDRSKVSTA